MKNRTLRNIFNVLVSNIVTVVSGVLVGFLIPKILSVEGYGLYKTFTLYVTYIGLFSLGIIDGIVLKYGGTDYGNYDINRFRNYFKYYVSVNLLFTIAFTVIGLTAISGAYKFVFVAFGLNILAVNITGYFQQISQITQRFKEYSNRKIIQAICNIASVMLLYGLYIKIGNIDYRMYVSIIVLTNYILMIWYVSTYKDISLGKSIGVLKQGKEILYLISAGFPLLFANLCSTLILTLDRQFVNVLFDTSTYAIYAFAYNMLSLVTVATSAIATVLYPMLKRLNAEKQAELLQPLGGAILVFVYAVCMAFFFLEEFVKWFLPHYTESLQIFRIIFPGFAISAYITVVLHNYYKIKNKNIIFFRRSLMILIISFLANMGAYFFVGTPSSISVASIVTMILWYIYAEQYFVETISYSRKTNLIYMLIMMGVFYVATSIKNILIGGVLYGTLFVLVTFVTEKRNIMLICKMLA